MGKQQSGRRADEWWDRSTKREVLARRRRGRIRSLLRAEGLEARTLLSVTSITAPYPNPPTTPVVEGTQWSGQIANFTTNDGGLPYQYNVMVNWGDGTSPSPGTVTVDGSNPSLYDVAASHTYRNAASYAVTISIQDSVDDTNAAGTGQLSVAPEPLSPTATQPSVVTTQNQSLTNVDVATFTDMNPLALPSDFTASIDWGDGQSAGTLVEDSNNVFHVEGSHTYTSASPPAGFDLQVTILHTGTASSLTINNLATVAAASMSLTPGTVSIADSSINGSGQAYIPAGTVVGVFTDQAGSLPTSDYTSVNSFVRFPGASANTLLAISPTVPNGSTYTALTAADTIIAPRLEPGTSSFALQITNSSNGVVVQGNGVLSVSDAPLAQPVNGQPTLATQTRGTSFTGAVAGFTDPNTLAPPSDYSATINWGDGTASTNGTVVQTSPGVFTVDGTHVYSSASPPAGFPISVHVQEGSFSSIALANTMMVQGAALQVTAAPVTVSDASINAAGQAIIPAGTMVGTFTDTGGPDALVNYAGPGSFVSFQGASANTLVLAAPIVPGGSTFTVTTAAATVILPRLTPGTGKPFTLQITNTDGAITQTTSGTYSVTDAPLSIPSTGAPLVAQQVRGASFTATVAAYTDPDTLAVASDFTAMINWGDGTAPSVGIVSGSAGSFTVQGTHTYTVASPPTGYPISVAIQGPVSSLVAPNTILVTGSALGLTVSPVTVSAGTVNGLMQSIIPSGTVVGTFTDAGGGDPASNYMGIGSYVSFPGALGQTPITATPTAVGSATFTVATSADAVFSPRLLPGSSSFLIRIMNTDGGSTVSGTGVLTATDPPITAPTSGQPTIAPAVLGMPLTANVAAFTDGNPLAMATDFTALINWGDGSPPTQGVITGPSGGVFSVVGTHTYTTLPSGGGVTYSISVDLADHWGATLPVTNTISAIGAPLNLTASPTSVSAGAVNGLMQSIIPLGTVVGSFTDTGGGDPAADYTGSGSYVSFPGAVGQTPVTVTPIATGSATFTIATGANAVFSPRLLPGSSSFLVKITNSVGGATASATGLLTVTDPPITTPASGQPAIAGSVLGMPLAATVAVFTDGNPLAAAGDFTALINWGDGSPPTPGVITEPSAGVFSVIGSHTYMTLPSSGGSSYAISVQVADHWGAMLSLSNTIAATAPQIMLTGQLNPATDTGASAFDAITRDVQPNFFGQTGPDAAVSLYAQAAGGPAILMGQAVSTATGAWSITSTPLAQGVYSVYATVVDQFGATRATAQLLPNSQQGPLTIETSNPEITGVSLDRAKGQISITYSGGPGGLNQASLISGANYRMSKRNAYLAPNLVSQIWTTAPATPTGSQTVTLQLNHGRPLPNGYYYLTVDSGGIQDAAGNPLNGLFTGALPTGASQAGGNFLGQFVLSPRKTEGPLPVTVAADPLHHGRPMVEGAGRAMAHQALDSHHLAALDMALAEAFITKRRPGR